MSSVKSNKPLFYLIAFLLPIVVLVLLELALRAVGFGQQVPLFIKNPQAPEYMLPKPDVVSRYFVRPEDGPNVTIETNFLLAEKPDNGLRLIVQGGSTAAGFPYGFGASIAGMLDYRLKQTYPNREVEVINTALSAVNSYTLLDFADEIIEQQPDAVVIYAGHNEYLGIMGVGSSYSAYSSRGANLLFLKLKNLRLFQLMQRAYRAVQGDNQALSNQADRQSRTVMAKVAKHRQIAIDNPLFDAGMAQFKGNMTLLLGKYKAAGIPVFISTIASNLSDQVPFESTKIEQEFQPLLNKPVTQWNAIEQAIIEKQAEKHKSAEAYYRLGQRHVVKERYAQAKNAFEMARQHDQLRFRAPMEFNQIIRQLATDENVILVDAEAQLAAQSPNGIIGKTLMLEHLHPNIKGYFEIADAFYNVIINSTHLPEATNTVKRFNALQELPIFDSEIYKGEATIAGLMADYPFTAEAQSVRLPPVRNGQQRMGLKMHQKRATWLDAAQYNFEQAKQKGEQREIVKTAKLLSDAMPFNVDYAFQAGSLLIQTQQSALAIRYLQRALRHDANNINVQLALAHANANLGQLKQAEQWLLSVQKLDADNQVVKDNLNAIQQAILAQ